MPSVSCSRSAQFLAGEVHRIGIRRSTIAVRSTDSSEVGSMQLAPRRNASRHRLASFVGIFGRDSSASRLVTCSCEFSSATDLGNEICRAAPVQMTVDFAAAIILSRLATATESIGTLTLLCFVPVGGEYSRAVNARRFTAEQFDRDVQRASANGTGLSEKGFHGRHLVESFNGMLKTKRLRRSSVASSTDY